MKYNLALGLAALAIFAVAACNNTADGMKEDSRENRQEAEVGGDSLKNKTDDAAANMKEGTKDLAAAATLTPMIKSAIVANPFLNDAGNKIDVNSNDEQVSLDGMVKSEGAKKEAEKIAKEVMKDNKAHQKLVNNLKIAK